MSDRADPPDQPEPPEPSGRTPEGFDAQWDDLVRRLGEESEPREPFDDAETSETSAATEVSGEPEEDTDPTDPAGRGLPAEASGRDWDATTQIARAEAEVDDAEHFVPPDPGPVLGGDSLLTMAWLAAGVIPLFWLLTVLFWRSAPPLLIQASAVVWVLTVGLLVWRLPPRRRDPDDDPGAVV